MRSDPRNSELRRGSALRSEAMDQLLDLLARLETLAIEAARPSLPLKIPVRATVLSPALRRRAGRR